ncbi:unnamed protein product [Lepeophtheirus salmonis]|uniref:(salmon louse) hypothetical protein n=1 Tax=Lepeophtheirus salmonis TaxID=72036 RepID=A0A7R8D0Y5_LEPSM|nr:unnamed protein product [Lepeophtheirus salmonis]CAF2988972.1 unnamed protein product [Lepeophtheirus salmonis]
MMSATSNPGAGPGGSEGMNGDGGPPTKRPRFAEEDVFSLNNGLPDDLLIDDEGPMTNGRSNMMMSTQNAAPQQQTGPPQQQQAPPPKLLAPPPNNNNNNSMNARQMTTNASSFRPNTVHCAPPHQPRLPTLNQVRIQVRSITGNQYPAPPQSQQPMMGGMPPRYPTQLDGSIPVSTPMSVNNGVMKQVQQPPQQVLPNNVNNPGNMMPPGTNNAAPNGSGGVAPQAPRSGGGPPAPTSADPEKTQTHSTTTRTLASCP